VITWRISAYVSDNTNLLAKRTKTDLAFFSQLDTLLTSTTNHGDNMKQPSRQDTVNVRVWRGHTGVETIVGITGIIEYPMAIHRPITEFEEIQQGRRSRYSGIWSITHIPTGKSFGIRSKNWNNIVGYVEGIKDEPALLMLTDKTMTEHPCFQQLTDKHVELRKKFDW
jgi:hypothetical protein